MLSRLDEQSKFYCMCTCVHCPLSIMNKNNITLKAYIYSIMVYIYMVNGPWFRKCFSIFHYYFINLIIYTQRYTYVHMLIFAFNSWLHLWPGVFMNISHSLPAWISLINFLALTELKRRLNIFSSIKLRNSFIFHANKNLYP